MDLAALAFLSYGDFSLKGYARSGPRGEAPPGQAALKGSGGSWGKFLKSKSSAKPEEILRSRIQGALARSHELISSMERGEYFAAPKDKKDCKSCFARKMCRASHLHIS